MKYKVFDVVELNNGSKATILDNSNNKYKAEIVNDKGIRQGMRNICDSDINRIIISK